MKLSNMRNYITRLSKEDFKMIQPNHLLESDKSCFPQVVALISDQYPSLPNNDIANIHLTAVKHIYSTRDYWEVVLKSNPKRHKIPKKYTDAIYLIEED